MEETGTLCALPHRTLLVPSPGKKRTCFWCFPVCLPLWEAECGYFLQLFKTSIPLSFKSVTVWRVAVFILCTIIQRQKQASSCFVWVSDRCCFLQATHLRVIAGFCLCLFIFPFLLPLPLLMLPLGWQDSVQFAFPNWLPSIHNAFCYFNESPACFESFFFFVLLPFEISLVKKKEGKQHFPLIHCLGADLSYLFSPVLAFYAEYVSSLGCIMGRSQISFSPVLFFRISLNWGKQRVANLPSDRLLRRVQVKTQNKLMNSLDLFCKRWFPTLWALAHTDLPAAFLNGIRYRSCTRVPKSCFSWQAFFANSGFMYVNKVFCDAQTWFNLLGLNEYFS